MERPHVSRPLWPAATLAARGATLLLALGLAGSSGDVWGSEPFSKPQGTHPGQTVSPQGRLLRAIGAAVDHVVGRVAWPGKRRVFTLGTSIGQSAEAAVWQRRGRGDGVSGRPLEQELAGHVDQILRQAGSGALTVPTALQLKTVVTQPWIRPMRFPRHPTSGLLSLDEALRKAIDNVRPSIQRDTLLAGLWVLAENRAGMIDLDFLPAPVKAYLIELKRLFDVRPWAEATGVHKQETLTALHSLGKRIDQSDPVLRAVHAGVKHDVQYDRDDTVGESLAIGGEAVASGLYRRQFVREFSRRLESRWDQHPETVEALLQIASDVPAPDFLALIDSDVQLRPHIMGGNFNLVARGQQGVDRIVRIASPVRGVLEYGDDIGEVHTGWHKQLTALLER